MNYEEMSDFEINQLVAKASFDVFAACHDGSKVNGVVRVDGVEFNPCNNPSDAWPIIFNNKISIHSQGLNSNLWCATCCYNCEIKYVSPSPLRAAMICFLKMKDSEKWQAQNPNTN